ncbi:hypothetical protein HMPREF1986_02156 [Oribacterium sp. oral taxon 078 str. F0263]|nr:hypothetical protein HMPREF1986_02156 [Oribacterium sp. oral taxon 078 str. F0263]
MLYNDVIIGSPEVFVKKKRRPSRLKRKEGPFLTLMELSGYT